MVVKGLSPSEDEALAYRKWLRLLVGELAALASDNLFEIAWNTEYIPTVPNDENRAHDGLDLRHRYVHESSNGLPPIGRCTMLEFLVALAHRLNEQDWDSEAPNMVGAWFWTLIGNLGLLNATDIEIFAAFERINKRTYAFDGYGGLFPLSKPERNQREVEIWYQMQAYLIERRYS